MITANGRHERTVTLLLLALSIVASGLLAGACGSSPSLSVLPSPLPAQHRATARDFEARWIHSISGYTDVEAVDVLGNRFRLSTRCLTGSSCSPLTEILNGTRTTVCIGLVPKCRSTVESKPTVLGSQDPFTNLIGVAYIRSLYHDLMRVGVGQMLGASTTCWEGTSSIGPATKMHFCLLDSIHVIASLDAPGEHWRLVSLTGNVSLSRFVAP